MTGWIAKIFSKKLKGLCFFVVVTEKYQRYMPLFAYFCFKAYPDCGVRILLSGHELDYKYTTAVRILEDMGDFKMQTVIGYPQTNKIMKRILRWVWTDDGFFDSYENVFITDVDILICRERPSLEEQHLKHCRVNKLPYSNLILPNKRLSGHMHFVKRREYYRAATNKVIEKYAELLEKGELADCDHDEKLLYKIVEESGLGFPVVPFHSYHGLHLGIWRTKEHKSKILKGIKEGSVSLGNYEEYLSFYQSLKQKDSLFAQMSKDGPLRELEYMEEWIKEWQKGS